MILLEKLPEEWRDEVAVDSGLANVRTRAIPILYKIQAYWLVTYTS